MNLHLPKKSILKKTMQVGASTFLSRIVAIAREALQIRFFGVGGFSDAFIAAFRIPNLFRHVFAEGALNASFIPVLVKRIKENKKDEANGLMSLAFLFFQGAILLLYLFIFLKVDSVVKLIAPGFSLEQAAYTGTFLKILFPYLFFVSSSALLAGSLNAINHFFVPAFGPALWNMTYVTSIIICLIYKFPATYLCWGMLIAGLFQFILHIIAYFKYHFTFGKITQESKDAFKEVMKRFFPCLLGVSIIEINLLVSGQIASYLPEGSVSLLYYASRFMNLPLGIFAVAFASILLPHFSRVILYAPKRMGFYMLEVTKFISWVIIPITIGLMLIAKNLFLMLFLAQSQGTLHQIHQAQWILIIYCTGLLFFCLNKVFLNMLYSFKDTKSTTIISGAGALVNILSNLVAKFFLSIYGMAFSLTLSGISMTALCFFFLKHKHGVSFYAGNYFAFLGRYLMQVITFGSIALALYQIITIFIVAESWQKFFTEGLGFWILAASIIILFFYTLHSTRKKFGATLYFLR